MPAKLLVAFWTLLVCGSATAQSVDELAQRFGHLPALSMPRLSPDGRYLALQVPRNGVPAIMSIDLQNGDRRQWLVATERGGFKIVDCQWAKNDRLLCIADYTAIRQMQPYYEFAIYSLSADGTDVKEILRDVPFVRFVNRLADDPQNIAIESGFRGGLQLLNVYTGATEQLAPARPTTTRWELSDDGETAVAFGITAAEGTDGFTLETWTWSRQTKRFTRLESTVAANVYTGIVGLDREGRNALLLGDERGRQALLALPLDGQPARTLLRDDTYDVGGFDALPGLSHLAGRATVVTDVLEHRWLDDGLAESQRALDGLMQGAKAFVETASQDMERSVVLYEGDRVTPRYVLFDSDKQPRVLGAAYPDLDNDKLAQVRLARVPMRDGLAIDVFVTEPPTRPSGVAKAVVLPHGGPEARDYRRFDFVAQFLAANGYVVLQPNFRGSSGYGSEFLAAGRRGWGTAMHNDITDTARWAIDEKLADAGHLCIVGISYGGYAALLGVAKEPDLYACAVSVAGPSDLGNLLWDFGKMLGGRDEGRERIGWDRSELDAQSPLKLAGDIQAPVLLIHGKLDTRVEPDHSQRMARELRRNDKSVEHIVQDNGDHFLRDQEQRIEMLREIGRFVGGNL